MSRTKPIESIAPTKAAAISAAEDDVTPRLSSRIIVTATVNLAPDEMPRTKGPAIGLWKNVCSRKPETERAPPRIIAASKRGRRIFSRMRRCVRSPPPWRTAHISDAGSRTLPARRFQIKKATSRTRSSRKPPHV